jgi:hypothetical protein
VLKPPAGHPRFPNAQRDRTRECRNDGVQSIKKQ